MSRFLIALELGGNLGHLTRCLPIAVVLRQHGHSVVFAVRDLRTAEELLAPAGFAFFPVAVLRQSSRRGRPPANYSEVLLGEGYADPLALAGLVRAWLLVLHSANVDAVLADHAPSALLAAHLAGIAHLAIGNGFAIPPRTSPLPSIRPWEPVTQERLIDADSRLDQMLTTVAATLGQRTSVRLNDLFSTADLLDTFAELDHFGVRPDGRYIGSIHGLAGTLRVAWQAPQRKKLFAYLRPEIPGFAALMESLRDADAEVICVVPGWNRESARRWATTHMRVSLGLLAIDHLLPEADVVVSYGSSGVTAAALLAGKPLLLVPHHVEQYLAARRVEALGAAIVAGSERSSDFFAASLAALMGQPAYADAARGFADRHAGFSPQQAVCRAVEALESLTANACAAGN